MNRSEPIPLDIRLMNALFAMLLIAFGVMVLLAGARAASRLSLFDIRGITVLGDTTHNNPPTLRANVAPRIAGTFFTADLGRVRAAFESVPWVRKAVVRREFPNRLKVVLQEHQPVALWGGDGDVRLVNSFGEVFEANVGEVDQEDLPVFGGPDGQSGEVLAMYRALEPLFAPSELRMEQIELSGRGSWSLKLDNGAVIELGRGTVEEVTARTHRFMKTLTQVVTRYGRQAQAVESADLRHENGYAIRLRGVSTLAPDAKKK